MDCKRDYFSRGIVFRCRALWYNMVMEKVVHKSALHDTPRDVAYWLAQPPEARIEAVEKLRRDYYGDAIEQRLQRVVNTAELHQG